MSFKLPDPGKFTFDRKTSKKRDCHIGDHISCPGEYHKDGSFKILARCHNCKWYIMNSR